VLNRTEIKSIDIPDLPDGYSFRAANGIEDAAARADVHNAAFGPIWTPELYRKVMESPGYEPERELVIQTPDGTFAAFSIIWFDHLNRTGLFEPVGTHKEHQRRGFGRAIICTVCSRWLPPEWNSHQLHILVITRLLEDFISHVDSNPGTY